MRRVLLVVIAAVLLLGVLGGCAANDKSKLVGTWGMQDAYGTTVEYVFYKDGTFTKSGFTSQDGPSSDSGKWELTSQQDLPSVALTGEKGGPSTWSYKFDGADKLLLAGVEFTRK